MLNYKFILMSVYLMLIGCSDQPDHFFHTIKQSALDKEIEYSNIHRMNLDISHMTKSIDESGFSPSLNASFSLKNNLSRSWPQAWVAFVINISIKDKLLATMTKSDSLHNHTLKVSINQLLPKFGIKEKDIHINVVPISWMPTYPLIIQPAVAPK